MDRLADAEYSYEALLKTDSKLVPAQAGLVRTLLRRQNVDEALATVNAALAAQPNSAGLLAAKGDSQFRRGEMAEAEASYLAALKLDQKELHAHLGLALLYSAYSMYRRAYEHIQIAHPGPPSRFVAVAQKTQEQLTPEAIPENRKGNQENNSDEEE
jgi:tetratricopeptide (TPR) repeat protein